MGAELTEAAFQRQVIELAQLYGWRVAHFRPARTADGWRTAVQGDGAGFPDLVLARRPELIFAELKSERGRPTAAQREWLDQLGSIAQAVQLRCEAAAEQLGEPEPPSLVDAYLWRPSDWPAIEARLRRRD